MSRQPGPGDSFKIRPLVSVIIPTHNRAYCLPKAVASALDQGIQDMEIVIVDDGSSDDTPQVLDTLVQAHGPDVIRPFRQENQGASAARNRAMKEARGEYLAFLDSDDAWTADSLRIRLDFLQERPEVGLVCGDSRHVRVEEVLVPSFLRERAVFDRLPDAPEPVPDPFSLLLESFFIVTSTSVTRAGVVREVGGFDVSMESAEDLEFFLRISVRHPVVCFHRVMVLSSVGVDNLGRDSERNARNQIYLLHKLDRIHPEYAREHQAEIEARLARRQAYLGKLLLIRGAAKDGREMLKRSLRLRPRIALLPYLLASYLGSSFLRLAAGKRRSST